MKRWPGPARTCAISEWRSPQAWPALRHRSRGHLARVTGRCRDALVPPLATVGYTIAVGRLELAGGAALLYAGNLSAIVFAGTVVFLVTGLTLQRPLVTRSRWVFDAVAATAMVLALVAVPLVRHSNDAIHYAQQLQEINAAVVAWLDANTPTGLSLRDVHVDGTDVTVDLTGPQQPPDTETPRTAVARFLDARTAVRVRWFQTS